MGWFVAFNPGQTTVVADAEGHGIEPHSWGVADEEIVREHLNAGRLFRVDVTSVKEEDTNPAVIMAKRELEERLRLQKPPSAPKSDTAATAPVKKTKKE